MHFVSVVAFDFASLWVPLADGAAQRKSYLNSMPARPTLTD